LPPNLQAVSDAATDQNFRELAAQFPIQGANLGAPAESVTALPTKGLFVGKQTIFKAATGVYWNLLYTKESAEYPWNKIGGPPLVAESTGSSTTASSAFTDLVAGAGPAVTLPLKGDYDVAIEAEASAAVVAGNGIFMSYAIGGTAAVEADSAAITPPGASAQAHLQRKRRKFGLAAVTLTTKYKSAGGNTNTYFNRRIEVDPVRVG
jgi:hypothetical protein